MPGSSNHVDLNEMQMQAVARALADPRRYEILQKLAASGTDQTACAAMRKCIDVSPATLSHHMKELETAGLVTSTRDGKYMHYKLNAPVLRAYRKRLADDLL